MQSNCKFLRDEPKARSLKNRLLNCKKKTLNLVLFKLFM